MQSLFTSIKPPDEPDDLAYLRACITSWRDAGFRAVSINGPSEIKKLRELDIGVEFVGLPVDGKPRIGEFLLATRESGARFAGIINSDCKIVGYPDLVAGIEANLAGTVILAWRLDMTDGLPSGQRGGCVGTYI